MAQESVGDRFVAAVLLGFDNQEEKAIEQLRALLPETPNDEERGWIILAEARFLGHLLRLAEARERYAEVRRLWTSTPEHNSRIAVGEATLYEAEGNPVRTLDELARILNEYAGQWHLPELLEPYEEIQATRGRLLVGQNRWQEALPLLEETLRSEKGKPAEFYYNLGYCYFMAEKWDESERWLKEALTKEPLPNIASPAHYCLGRLEYKKGDFARAVTELEAAEKRAIGSASMQKAIYGELARSYQKLGMKSEAIRYARLAHSRE